MSFILLLLVNFSLLAETSHKPLRIDFLFIQHDMEAINYDAMLSILKEEVESTLHYELGNLIKTKIPLTDFTANSIETLKNVIQTDQANYTFIVHLIREEKGGATLKMAVINNPNRHLFGTTSSVLPDKAKLNDYARTAVEGFRKLEYALPYQASIADRDRSHVTIDRGFPFFSQGTTASVFKIEGNAPKLKIKEIGKVQFTQVFSKVSIGKILTEVASGVIDTTSKFVVSRQVDRTESERNIASTITLEPVAPIPPRGNIGNLELLLGPSFTSFNQTVDGIITTTGTNAYSGGQLQSEILITSRVPFIFQTLFASSNIEDPTNRSGSTSTGTTLASSIFQWNFLLGYRFGESYVKPNIDFRIGYAAFNYRLEAPARSEFSGHEHSGLLLGSQVSYPLLDKLTVLGTFHTFLLGSTNENPVIEGRTPSSTSFLQLGLQAKWLFHPEVDFSLKFLWQSVSNDYITSDGLRTSNEQQNSIIGGICYYF